jgi:talin
VQINLLYGQSKDSIVRGQHPCTLDEAVSFAALTVQVDYGDHSAERHKPGFLDDLRAVLPAEYAKVKGVEKMVYAEHKKLLRMSEINVKYKYITMCRSLKTYGITFFTVKEKVKGKNKMITRLLGITRECVMRMDERTKEVLKTWPLTTVRRWVASENSFTLDFGDYAEYYTAKTNESDAISQLIAGYIDIILKKRREREAKASGKVGMAEEAETSSANATRAERVSIERGQVQHMSVIKGAAIQTMPGGGHRPRLRSSAQGQTSLASHITRAKRALAEAHKRLAQPASLPKLGSDGAAQRWRDDKEAVARQNLAAQVTAILAASASMVTLTSARADATRLNYTAVGSAVTTLGSNVRGVADATALLAALAQDNSAGDLLDAGRKLCDSLDGILSGLEDVAEGKGNQQQALAAAAGVGAAAQALLSAAQSLDMDRAAAEELMVLAKAVAAATTTLVEKAKTVAGRCEDAALQNSVITAARTSALATTQLVTCAKVLTPGLSTALCQDQLGESARAVAAAIERLVGVAQSACRDEAAVNSLGEAARAVSDALGALLSAIPDLASDSTGPATTGGKAAQGAGSGPGDAASSREYAEAVDAILEGTERLHAGVGETSAMVAEAKRLAQATAVIVNEIKGRAAGEADPKRKENYIASARLLADATAKLVAATKRAAQAPQDPSARAELAQAAAQLRRTMQEAAGEAVGRKFMANLKSAAKQTAMAGTQLVTAAQAASACNRSQASQQQLDAQSRIVAEHLGKMVSALKRSVVQKGDAGAQLALISRCREAILPGQRLVAAVKAAAPTVEEPAAAMQLTTASRAMGACLAELKSAVAGAMDACGALELENAAQSVSALGQQLQEAEQAAARGELQPLPSAGSGGVVTAGAAAAAVALHLNAVQAAVAQLASAVEQKDERYAGECAQQLMGEVQQLAEAVRAFAAAPELETATRVELLASGRAAMEQASQMLARARGAMQEKPEAAAQRRATLLAAAREMQESLGRVRACLPGQREATLAAAGVEADKNRLSGRPATTKKPDAAAYHAQQQQLCNTATELSQRASAVRAAASKGIAQDLAKAGPRVQQTHEALITQGLALAGLCSAKEDQTNLLAQLEAIANHTARVLLTGGELAVAPEVTAKRQQLAAAVRGLTASINALIDSCTEAGPGQKECDAAARTVMAALPALEEATLPTSESDFYTCLDLVQGASLQLGNGMSALAKACKDQETESFCVAVEQLCGAAVQLGQAASQSAYLVAVAEPGSEAGQRGLLDQATGLRAREELQAACAHLFNPASSKAQVLEVAKVVALHSSREFWRGGVMREKEGGGGGRWQEADGHGEVGKT